MIPLQKNRLVILKEVWIVLVLSVFLLFSSSICFADLSVRVGSKRFTESYILCEIIAQILEKNQNINVIRKPGLGNTGILFSALEHGDVDIYPEYLGTISQEILHENTPLTLTQVNLRLKPLGLEAAFPLGFSNSYALAMPNALALQLNIQSISDLANHPQLRFGFSHEFLARKDGWRSLAQVYGLHPSVPMGLDHGLSYAALNQAQVDVIDVYTTDAHLSNSEYKILLDDRLYFPNYSAVLLYKQNLAQHPEFVNALTLLNQRINLAQMQEMNHALENESQSVQNIAQAFLSATPRTNARLNFLNLLFDDHFFTLTFQHLLLVLSSLALAVLIGVPFGVLAFCRPNIGYPIRQLSGVLQTIPSLALLAFLIFILHSIGTLPAIIALTLYALLPIIENTHTGLQLVSKDLKEAAAALGSSFWPSLLFVELPQAIPAIFSGVKIAAITATGTATIAAFVGAGGYGQRIAEGLAINNNAMMLSGAIPAAIFAIFLQIVLTWLERQFNVAPAIASSDL